MFVPLLLLILVMCGMAIDSGLLYNRHVELSGMARAVALAAAKQLNGTSAGITAAQASAKLTAERFTYQYGLSITWNDAALSFGNSSARSGTWVGAGEVANPATFHFVRVDTAALAVNPGRVRTLFMGMFSRSLSTVGINGSAIAGRTGMNVVPIAICAMSDLPASERTNAGLAETELVEYGFRRGVSYDLMRLNPKGTTPARFLINPVISPGTSSTSFNTGIIGPFACVGTTWIPRLSGGSISVSSLPATSPLDAVFNSLNSRFDNFAQSQCNWSSAPPDANIRQYPYSVANGAPWMMPATGTLAATSTIERGWLETIADIPSPGTSLSTVTAGSYGPLWSYARAAKYADYVQGTPEPVGGYRSFATTDWAKLYRTGLSATNYPNVYTYSTPYNPVGSVNPSTVLAVTGAHTQFATAGRRVLNVPLLSCSAGVPSGASVGASVAGIGRFFMTIPATRDYLIAEFAGAVPESAITGSVELFP